MRFAASSPAVEAYGLYSGFEPVAVGRAALLGRNLQKRTNMAAESAVKGTQLETDAMVEAAEYGADATVAQGAAAGQASMMSGLSSGISSIAGAIPGIGGTASSTPAFGSMPGTPVSDSYMDKLTSFYGA